MKKKSRWHNAAFIDELTTEQREKLNDYYWEPNSQADFQAQENISDIFNSLQVGLGMVYGRLDSCSEWDYFSQCRGLVPYSLERRDWEDGYYEPYVEGMGGKPWDALPETYNGIWSDVDIAEAFNRHIDALTEKWNKTYDAVNEFYNQYCAWENGEIPYDEYPEEADRNMYDTWYELVVEHELALQDMCHAAEKSMSDTCDYYYSDEGFTEWVNNYSLDELLDMIM